MGEEESAAGGRWQILGEPSAGIPLFADFKFEPAFSAEPAAQHGMATEDKQISVNKFILTNFADRFVKSSVSSCHKCIK